MLQPYSSTHSFYSISEVTPPSSSDSDRFFTNHQKWQINRNLDLETGLPVFHLIDSYGIQHTVTEFVVENMDPDFGDVYNRLTTPQEHEEQVHKYLQERLNRATPYQIHVEIYQNQRFIRFGDYGLKGGDKWYALLASIGQIIAGIYLNSTGLSPVGGDTLITSGISGGTYVLQYPEHAYEDKEYFKQTVYGGISGLISSGLAKLYAKVKIPTKIFRKVLGISKSNIETLARIGFQALGVSLGNAAVMTAPSVLEGKEWPEAIEIAKKSGIEGLGCGIGTIVSAAVGNVLNQLTSRNVDDLPTIVLDILKKTIQGSAGTSCSKITKNLCKKKKFNKDLKGTALSGAIVSACLAVVNNSAIQWKKAEYHKKWVESRRELLKALKINEQDFQDIIKSFENDPLHYTLGVIPETKILLTEAGIDVSELSDSAFNKDSIQSNYELLEAYNLKNELITLSSLADYSIQSNIKMHIDNEWVLKILKEEIASQDPFYLIHELELSDIEIPNIPDSEINDWVTSHIDSIGLKSIELFKTFLVTKLLHNLKNLCLENKLIVLTQEEIDAGLEASDSYLSARAIQLVPSFNQFPSEYLDLLKIIEREIRQMFLINHEICKDLFITTIPQLKTLPIERNPSLIQTRRLGEILETALKPDSVTLTEKNCSMEELIPHVVLVQALSENTIEHYKGPDAEKAFDDPILRVLCCLKAVVTPEGRIGHHLDYEKWEFQKEIPDRFHLHWSWNQLVQPHKDSWEDSPIAILEPLASFEDTVMHKPFGIAPYDTLTLGEHYLSKNSILLIPKTIKGESRAYLENFKGTIVPYNPTKKTIRTAVIDMINHLNKHLDSDKQIWHVCDGNGNLVGKEVFRTNLGYRAQTCLMKDDGKILYLIQKEGLEEGQKYETMKKYSEKRFIGLHVHSITMWLEKNDDLKTLVNFTKNKSEIVKNNTQFAGKIPDDSLANLMSIKALKFYQNLLKKYDSNTGVGSVANYVMNAALHADLVSIFHQMNPDAQTCDLTPLELHMIFSPQSQVEFITLLSDIQDELEKAKIDNIVRPNESFKLYRDRLEKCLTNMCKARDEKNQVIEKCAFEDVSLNKENLVYKNIQIIGQDAWNKVVLPDDIQFDLGKNWPLNEQQIYSYVITILHGMTEYEEHLETLNELEKLYKYVSALALSGEENGMSEPSEKDHVDDFLTRQKENDRKEKYRLNILKSLILWVIQELHYSELKNREILGELKNLEIFGESSIKISRKSNGKILADKLSKMSGSLGSHYLKETNFTKIKTPGNCLFDNVLGQMRNPSVNSQLLREATVKFMEENHFESKDKEHTLKKSWDEPKTINSWRDYLNYMRESEVWGTELEIEALAEMLNCPIVLVDKNADPIIYNRKAFDPDAAEEDKSMKKQWPVFLYRKAGNYFASCAPSDKLMGPTTACSLLMARDCKTS